MSRRQRLPELLLLLRGVQGRSLAERPRAHRPAGAGRLLACLLPHLLPALQRGLLGGLPLPLAAGSARQMGSGDSKKRTGTPVENVSGFPGAGTPQVWGPKEELHAAAALSLNVCVEAVWAPCYPAISRIQLMKSLRALKPFTVPSSGGGGYYLQQQSGNLITYTFIKKKKGGEIIKEPPLSDISVYPEFFSF